MNNDEQIVEAVKQGRREGYAQMVSRYGQQCFAMIARMVSVMDAEELTQDTFLRAFSRIDSYDSRRASLGTWLCRIAYRLTLDFMRRRRPVIIPIDSHEAWQADISDEQIDRELSTAREERIQQLERLMDQLPPDELLLLTLYYFENRTLDECSYIMDAKPHALAGRLYRLRRKLYDKLKKNPAVSSKGVQTSVRLC